MLPGRNTQSACAARLADQVNWRFRRHMRQPELPGRQHVIAPMRLGPGTVSHFDQVDQLGMRPQAEPCAPIKGFPVLLGLVAFRKHQVRFHKPVQGLRKHCQRQVAGGFQHDAVKLCDRAKDGRTIIDKRLFVFQVLSKGFHPGFAVLSTIRRAAGGSMIVRAS